VTSVSHILVRPLVTEKSMSQLTGDNDFAFEVALDANKIQIKEAVERIYGVHVVSVRTLVQRGKTKRTGRHLGKRSNWKKAYVRLAEGESLNLLGA
jgi:large subunit ribosomal protein L23